MAKKDKSSKGKKRKVAQEETTDTTTTDTTTTDTTTDTTTSSSTQGATLVFKSGPAPPILQFTSVSQETQSPQRTLNEHSTLQHAVRYTLRTLNISSILTQS